jgi:hypothetical protein
MSDAPIDRPRVTNPQDDELAGYQAVCGLAVTALVVGLASVVALAHPALWLVPAVGVLLGAAALRRIAQNAPALVGRKAAAAGLLLAVLFGTAAPTGWLVHRWLADRQARRFALVWFELLARDQPQGALQLTRHPNYRRPLDEPLPEAYAEGLDARDELKNYVAKPEVRTLLALGPKARVRYYDTEGQGRADGRDVVRQVYAVTYEDAAGKPQSWFVAMTLERYKIESTGRARWRIEATDGGVRPIALGGPKEPE